MAFRKKHPVAALLLTCYGGWLAVMLLWHLAGFAQNRLYYATGDLAPGTLAVQDFDLHQIEMAEDGTLTTTGADPQLLLKDTARRVENITIEFGYTKPPRVVTAFWGTAAQGHSVWRMAYPQSEGKAAVFCLPAGGGQGLRLDPGVVKGNQITVHSITINQPRPFQSFFVFSPAQIAAFAIVPGLLACGIAAVRQGLAAYKDRPRNRPRRKGAR